MNAEGNVDVIVRERFFPVDSCNNVFIDVGAAKPEYLSISALYRSIGWRIIAIEPNPVFCELHQEKGYEVLQYACGTRDEDNVDFIVVDSHGANYHGGQVSYESFSSLGIKESYASLKPTNLDTKTIKVNLRRLDTILENHAPDIECINILSVNVEGWELEVLRGLGIAKYRPRVMIVENLFNDKEYKLFMANNNYMLWKRLPPNDVYVNRDLIPNSLTQSYLSLKNRCRDLIPRPLTRLFLSLKLRRMYSSRSIKDQN